MTRTKKPLLFLAGLLVGLAAVLGMYLGAQRWIAGAAPVFLPGSERPVGQAGPVGLRFPQPVDTASVESHLSLEPRVEGKWSWLGQTAWFTPRTAFAEKQLYNLRLEPGAVSASGRILPGGSWRFTARAPWLAYLSPANAGREVWRAAADGSVPQQLTHTGGRVQDFSVTLDGEQVVFTAGNEQGGADVWSVQRDGQNAARLVDCGSTACSGAAVSSDGSRIAYSHIESAGQPGVPYLYERDTGRARAIYADILIRGEYFSWSPDGNFLAMYDPGAGAVRIYDLRQQRDTLFESNLPGPAAWSPDSHRLLFLTEDRQAGFTRVVIFLADLEKQELKPILEGIAGDDSGLPVWSPGGEELLFSQRIISGSASRQLYRVKPDGSGLRALTDDLRYTAAAYQWSPDGQRILFQRFPFGSSDNVPEVVVWDAVSGELRVVARNAAQPRWLP